MCGARVRVRRLISVSRTIYLFRAISARDRTVKMQRNARRAYDGFFRAYRGAVALLLAEILAYWFRRAVRRYGETPRRHTTRDAMIRASLMASPAARADTAILSLRIFRCPVGRERFRGREKFEKNSPVLTGRISRRETKIIGA